MSVAVHRIDASAARAVLPAADFCVTRRDSMAYAAAIGLSRPEYFDDVAGGALRVFPAIIVVPEWAVVNGPSCRAALAASDEQMWRWIHVEQYSRFAREMTPGMRLRTTGRIVLVRQTSIGVLTVLELETTDASDASEVARSWFSGIFLGAALDGEPAQEREMPRVPAFDAGAARPERIEVAAIDRATAQLYTAATGIWNPIHTDAAVSRRFDLGAPIVHGTAVWAMASRALHEALGGPAAGRITALGGRMKGQVRAGDRLALSWVPRERADGRQYLWQVTEVASGRAVMDGVMELGATGG